MLIGFSKTSSAVICTTAVITCGDGNGSGYALVCGEDIGDLINNAIEIADVMCGQ